MAKLQKQKAKSFNPELVTISSLLSALLLTGFPSLRPSRHAIPRG